MTESCVISGKGIQVSIKLLLSREPSFPLLAFLSSSGKSGSTGGYSFCRDSVRDAEHAFNAAAAAGVQGRSTDACVEGGEDPSHGPAVPRC